MRRYTPGRGDAEHALDLQHRRAWSVGRAKTHRDGALSQAFPEERLHCGHLRLAGDAGPADANRHEPAAGVAKHFHACRDVSDRDAVVDDLAAFAGRIPTGDVGVPTSSSNAEVTPSLTIIA
jgi:hypothetical protein